MRILRVGVAALLLAACLSVPAAAEVSVPRMRLSPGIGPPGTDVTVLATGFQAFEPVVVRFDSTPLVRKRADSGGHVVTGITVPDDAAPGSHLVDARGTRSHRIAQANFLVPVDWPQFHYSAEKTGFNPFEDILGPSTVSGLLEDWFVSTGGAVEGSPVVVGGKVFVSSTDGVLHAYDATSGAFLWATQVGGSLHGTPAVGDGRIFVEYGPDRLYALDAETGEILWNTNAGGDFHSPAFSDGVVYSYGQQNLFAVNAATGATMWSFGTNCGGCAGSQPTVADGRVYVGGFTFYAIDAATGNLLWTNEASNNYSTGAFAEGTIYVGADKLYSYDALTGDTNWSLTVGNSFTYSSPAVANGVVFAAAGTDLFAVDGATGITLWVVTTDFIETSPAVANGVVYVGTDSGRMLALDASSGTQLWETFPGSGALRSSPIVLNGHVYVGSLDGALYTYSLPE
jgi:outer membrane protein assembly factor BamB